MTIKEILETIFKEENTYSGGDGFKYSCYFENGMLPHFHYKNNRVEGCIRLDVPRYFCHNSNHDGLNSGEKKVVLIYLKNNWKNLVEIWNKSATVKVNTEAMPDYNLLPNLNSTTGKLNKEDRK